MWMHEPCFWWWWCKKHDTVVYLIALVQPERAWKVSSTISLTPPLTGTEQLYIYWSASHWTFAPCWTLREGETFLFWSPRFDQTQDWHWIHRCSSGCSTPLVGAISNELCIHKHIYMYEQPCGYGKQFLYNLKQVTVFIFCHPGRTDWHILHAVCYVL